MRSSSTSQKDWEMQLIEYLRNYRATPHTSTGVSPNQLIFQADVTTSKVPFHHSIEEPHKREKLHLNAQQKDAECKEKLKLYGYK